MQAPVLILYRVRFARCGCCAGGLERKCRRLAGGRADNGEPTSRPPVPGRGHLFQQGSPPSPPWCVRPGTSFSFPPYCPSSIQVQPFRLARRDPPVGSSPWGCVQGGRPHGSVGCRKMGKMDESPSSRSGQRVSAGEEPEGVGAELGRVEEETEEEDQRDGEQHQCNSPKCFDPLLKAL